MVSGAAHISLIRRWGANMAFFILGTMFAALCQGVEEEPTEESLTIEEDWERHVLWARNSDRSAELARKIEEKGHPLKAIAYPAGKLPRYVKARKLHGLINDLLYQLDLWLKHHSLKYPPFDDNYTVPSKVEKPLEEFLEDVTNYDGILVPSIAYMLHFARGENSPLSDKEKEFLEFRLEWINTVTLPHGMTIDWEGEYKSLISDFEKSWVGAIALPKVSTLDELKTSFSQELKQYSVEYSGD